jgi:hypothetical protein
MYLLTGFLILAIVVSWGRYCRLNHRVSPSSLPKIKLYFQVRENLSDIQRSDYIQSSKNKGCSYDARSLRQNPVEGLPRFIGYDVLVLNTGDDLYRSTAMTANLDIDIEDALEPLGPGHRDVPFSG